MALRWTCGALLLWTCGALAQVPDQPAASPASTPASAAEAAPATAMPAAPAADAALPAADAAAGASAPPATAAAPAAAARPAYADAIGARTREVLAGPDFRQRKTLQYPAPREWLRKWLQGRGSKPSSTPPPNLALLGTIFKYLALVVLALGLAWLLWRGWQWLAPGGGRPAPGPGAAVPEARYLALPDGPLPAAITPAARTAWQAGDAALALSLLYRGAVRDLAQRHRIELPDSATEGECLRQARRSGAAVVTAGFAPIVQAWMALAYARRAPADFEALLALYARYFEASAGAAS